MAAVSPKAATFPQTEELLQVTREGADKKPEIHETLPQGKNVVIGCRPCGARGKLIFNPVYDTEKIKHQYFIQRRHNTIFITLACDRPETTCFCHSVGGGPADTAGSDVLLTLVGEGYVARSVTPEGEEILKHALFEDAGSKGKEADGKNAKALEMMGPAHDYASAPAKILARFDDMDFWTAQSAKCISCGACTYMCPTCYCFNITDDDLGLTSRRIRTWVTACPPPHPGGSDTIASDQGPSPENRVGHKFSTIRTAQKGHRCLDAAVHQAGPLAWTSGRCERTPEYSE
jgi:ferredoxin